MDGSIPKNGPANSVLVEKKEPKGLFSVMALFNPCNRVDQRFIIS